ncbi:nitrate/nitrite transporter [Halopenitus salinus]|uniref:Nitrate/nitrite transporter n=1 Tax=Halopenitus salinus TaxID=1198295 RepID=A0ABD5UYS5_9EURY
MLLLIVLGTTSAFVGRNIFGPLLPSIIEDLAITSAEAGTALSAMWVAIAVTQYPGGRLADQLSYKTVLIGAMTLLTAGFLTLLGTSTYAGFVVGLVVMGLGGGLFSPSSYAQLAALFEERRGQAFGVYTASIDIGSALSGAIAIGVLAVATWRVAFLPVAAALVCVIGGMHFLHRGRYELDVSEVTFEVRGTVRRILGEPRIRWIIVAYILMGLVFQGVLGFLPAFLQFAKGFSSTLANNFFVAFFVVGAAVRIVAGNLGDRFRHLTVAAGAAASGAVGLSVLYVAESTPLVALGAALLAAGITGYPPVLNAYLMDNFPDTSMGGDYGAARSILILFGSAGPVYIGYLAEGYGYNLAFLALFPFFLAGGLVVLWIRSRNGRR